MRNRLNINLSVGRSCFVQCKGCYNHFGHDNKLVETSQILSFLAAAKAVGAERVTLCGGDPLSRPDIVSLIQQVRSLGFHISLDTVGTPILGNTNSIFFGQQPVAKIDAAQLAQLVHQIGIPVDGHTNEVAQKFRTGRPNFLSEQISIISILNDYGANICINTVVNRFNIGNLAAIYELISPYAAVRRWQLFQFTPSGPIGFKNRALYEINQEEFIAATSFIEQISCPRKDEISIECKSEENRRGNYLLIDANGIVWIPQMAIDGIPSAERVIIGDIKDNTQFGSILSIMLNPQEINFAQSAS